jgi:hypothetical protein
MRVERLATVALVAAAVCVAAGPAQAATVFENFDSYGDGVTITGLSGMTFPQSPRTFTPPSSRTASPPRALRNPLACSSGTCPNGAYRLRMDFTRPARAVSLKTGDVLYGCFEFDCPSARLTGFDSAGNVVADSGSASIPTGTYEQPAGFGANVNKSFAIDAGSFVVDHAILYVGRDDVNGEAFGSPRTAQIDDLGYTALDPAEEPPPPPPPPAAPTVEITDPAEGATFASADAVNASGTLTAPAGLAAFCLAVDNETTFPSPCDLGPSVRDDGTFSGLRVSGLHEGSNRITAWVRDGRGRTAQDTVTINVAPATLDLTAGTLEIIQAVQRLALPFGREAFAHGGLRGLLGDYDDVSTDPSFVIPSERLASGKRTFVRFFASAPGRGPVLRVRALLHAYSKDRAGALTELDGSPTFPHYSPARLERTLDIGGQRARSDAAYVFELPTAWTERSGELVLAGEVNPAGVPGVAGETAANRDDNVFAVEGVNFETTRTVTALPVNLYFLDGDGRRVQLSDFSAPFDGVRKVLPAALDVRPIWGAIDVSDIVAPDEEDQVQRMRDRLIEWSEGVRLPRGKIMGLINSGHGGLAGGRHGVTGSTNAKLDFVAHEFFHTLGFPHAGRSDVCYSRDADRGDSWPPDDRGVMRGVGLDVSPGPVYAPIGTRAAGVFDSPPAAPAEVFDFESYCSAEPATWIDPRNWDRGIAGLGRRGSINISSHRPPAVARAAAAGLLHVSAQVDDAGGQILRVEPASGRVATDPGSDLRLVVRDSKGAVVSDTGVPVQELHVRPAPGAPPEGVRYVNAFVPGRGAARVELVRAGTVLASRDRSKARPRVRVMRPAGTTKVGSRGRFGVKWRASDADGDELTARVDFSPDGGRSWRPLAVGLSGGRAVLDAAFLSRSSRAVVRVTVNDGFDAASARSAPFRTAGRAPSVQIVSPERGTRLGADAPLNLSGSAFDDAGRRLRGRALVWRSGGAVLGRGEDITIVAGEVRGGRVTLEARDRHGRIARLGRRLRIDAVQPFFLALSAKRPRRRAATLALRVSANVPATLTVTGRGVRRTIVPVARPTSTVRVPIDPPRKTFRLRLRLAASGLATVARVDVARR